MDNVANFWKGIAGMRRERLSQAEQHRAALLAVLCELERAAQGWEPASEPRARARALISKLTEELT